jgi:Acetyl-CoA carboxylase alpha subunit
VAESLRLTAADCLELNMVDEIVGEPITAAHESPDAAARQLRRIILTHLTDIGNWSNFRRSRRRYRKFRQIGEFTKNISALNELDPRSNDLTKLSKSKGSKVSDIKFRFQETDSLEKIDPYDHIHQTPED